MTCETPRLVTGAPCVLPLAACPHQPDRAEEAVRQPVRLRVNLPPGVTLRPTLHSTVFDGFDVPEVACGPVELASEGLFACYADRLRRYEPGDTVFPCHSSCGSILAPQTEGVGVGSPRNDAPVTLAAIVETLRNAGMSTRAIGAATGLSKDTVHRELSTVSFETVETDADTEPDEFPGVLFGAPAGGGGSDADGVVAPTVATGSGANLNQFQGGAFAPPAGVLVGSSGTDWERSQPVPRSPVSGEPGETPPERPHAVAAVDRQYSMKPSAPPRRSPQ